jgi:glycosyltransferase involved in cell wall biosynthesis
MLVSVVVITRNEAPRLGLVLESFAAQDLSPVPGLGLEVVVVDDGSTDTTRQVLASFEGRLQLRVVPHAESQGRSPSRNDGAKAATGEVLVLFDGDCLASPGLVARHAQIHDGKGALIGRGETYHIRSTRFFRDPESGAPFPGEEARVARMGEEWKAALVTRDQVRDRFDTVSARAEPGIYAGAGPRQLYELEMRALSAIPQASILWMTASGQNLSVRRGDFEAVGGFDVRLTLNEHRELAFRLYERGLRMEPVAGARSFHMLHRVGWRDPLDDTGWERIFYEAHPCLSAKLMSIFWLSLARDKDIPEEGRITSLEQLEDVVKNGTTFDYDDLRRRHPRLAKLEPS